MIAVLRLLLFVLAIQTVVFFVISGIQRVNARRRAWAEYEALPEPREDWDSYLDREMLEYHSSLRKKLIWSVYIIPLAVVALLVYFVNFA